jgi:hypothetical protein
VKEGLTKKKKYTLKVTDTKRGGYMMRDINSLKGVEERKNSETNHMRGRTKDAIMNRRENLITDKKEREITSMTKDPISDKNIKNKAVHKLGDMERQTEKIRDSQAVTMMIDIDITNVKEEITTEKNSREEVEVDKGLPINTNLTNTKTKYIKLTNTKDKLLPIKYNTQKDPQTKNKQEDISHQI